MFRVAVRDMVDSLTAIHAAQYPSQVRSPSHMRAHKMAHGNHHTHTKVATTTRIGGARVPGVRLYQAKVDKLLDEEYSMDLM